MRPDHFYLDGAEKVNMSTRESVGAVVGWIDGYCTKIKDI